MVEIKIDLDKCDGCATCVDLCPIDGILVIEDEKCVVKDLEECLACRACEVQCPNGSIEIIE